MTSPARYTPEPFPRKWLPKDATFHNWDEIRPWYQQLVDRPIDSADALVRWLEDVGELNSAVSEEGVKRYIAMTCQTDDPEREAAHLAWVREVEPRLKPYQNQIRERFLDSPHRSALDPQRFEILNRLWSNRRSLFRQANVVRETQLAELEQQYQKILGAMTVNFRGKDYTPAQMAPILEETDRNARQEAWERLAARRLADRDRLDDLFDQMVALRVAVAREAGFASFTDYVYRQRERFDYGVAEVERFRDAIEDCVVPLARQLQEKRRADLGIPTLRPWDLAVDPLGRAPLRPFENAEDFATGTQRLFHHVDPELGAQFAFLHDQGLLDLANRRGKAPGGYQETLEDSRLPFIFMNAVGIDGDLRTLLHEGGHAFHALAARGQDLAPYRSAPIEFCEVASMSMELLAARDPGVFYSAADADRSYRQLLEGIVTIFPWIATVDAFQHWVFAHPEHNREERRAAWNALLDRFGGIVDWSGYEEARSSSWHRQLHIFLYPFYYIEYGIAEIGALQVWKRSLADFPGAVRAYRRALTLGGSRPLPELFAAADLKFDFGPETLRPLMETLEAELSQLPG